MTIIEPFGGWWIVSKWLEDERIYQMVCVCETKESAEETAEKIKGRN